MLKFDDFAYLLFVDGKLRRCLLAICRGGHGEKRGFSRGYQKCKCGIEANTQKLEK
jgi:hypothetical protein